MLMEKVQITLDLKLLMLSNLMLKLIMLTNILVSSHLICFHLWLLVVEMKLMLFLIELEFNVGHMVNKLVKVIPKTYGSLTLSLLMAFGQD